MLKLSLLPEEYLTINEDIVVQLIRVAGGRASLAIHADREIPIVRGTVLEQEGKVNLEEAELMVRVRRMADDIR